MVQTQVTVESRPTQQQPVQVSPKQHPRRLEEKKLIFRTYQVIWYLLGLVETLLLFRFTFKLFGASQASPFVRVLYAASDGLTYPFRGIFPVGAVDRSIFEWASLVAMAVYAVFAYGLVYTLQLVKPVDPEDIEEAVDNP
jgi:uncharacterized protein YggT (Ycf19 family)